MINNIEQLKPLLNFSEKGDFYMLYVFKRKKDQPEGERDNHQSVRTIKTYCIDSIEYRTLVDASQKLNIHPTTINRRLKSDKFINYIYK
jgi:hypothetical protein